jgi:hypothetical protein
LKALKKQKLCLEFIPPDSVDHEYSIVEDVFETGESYQHFSKKRKKIFKNIIMKTALLKMYLKKEKAINTFLKRERKSLKTLSRRQHC